MRIVVADLQSKDGCVAVPLLASRGCPEAAHRVRSIQSIVNEIAYVCTLQTRPYIVFRDLLFTDDRDRCLALCDEILARQLKVRFECETRLDRLDLPLPGLVHRAFARLDEPVLSTHQRKELRLQSRAVTC